MQIPVSENIKHNTVATNSKHLYMFHHLLSLPVAAERDIVLEVSEHVKQEVIADLMEWVCTAKKIDLINLMPFLMDFTCKVFNSLLLLFCGYFYHKAPII